MNSLQLRKTLLKRTEPDLFARVATIDLPLVVIQGIASLAHPRIMITWVGRCNVRLKDVAAMLQTRRQTTCLLQWEELVAHLLATEVATTLVAVAGMRLGRPIATCMTSTMDAMRTTIATSLASSSSHSVSQMDDAVAATTRDLATFPQRGILRDLTSL